MFIIPILLKNANPSNNPKYPNNDSMELVKYGNGRNIEIISMINVGAATNILNTIAPVVPSFPHINRNNVLMHHPAKVA